MMVKSEVGFGDDNFKKPQVYNEKETLTRVLLNLLLTRPGCFPSMPWLGIDIKQYLYKNAEEIDPVRLKDLIYSQCQDLLPNLVTSEIQMYVKKENGTNTLLILFPLTIDTVDQVLFAFSNDTSGELNYKYAFQEARTGFTKDSVKTV